MEDIRRESIAEAFEAMCLTKIPNPDDLRGTEGSSSSSKKVTLKGSPRKKKEGVRLANLALDSEEFLCLDFSVWPDEQECILNLLRKLANVRLRQSNMATQQPICLRFRRTKLSEGILNAFILASQDGPMNTVLQRITCLDIRECEFIAWPALKDMLKRLPSLTTLIFVKDPWLSDDIMEQIFVKYNKQLRYVDMENSLVTDNSLHHMSKKCPNIKTLIVNHCRKIGNKGFGELRKVNLRSLMLSHNLTCTDGSLDVVLSNSDHLHRLRFVNCPLLTDNTITALFESQVSWGKKRNERSANLVSLEIAGNPNITHHSLLYLSTAVPGIRALDISECPSVNVGEALREMENFNKLEDLRIGPSTSSTHADSLVRSLLGHMHNLRCLHLNGISCLTDQDLADLMEETIVLSEIKLEDMNVGTLTIEALCSAVPNITSVSIIGSPILNDTDVRCLTAICTSLTSLTMRRCVGITDKGFSRCVLLRHLHYLNVGYLSPQVTGLLLTFFPVSPLEEIVLDGLVAQTVGSTVPRCNKRLFLSLKKLSLRECPSLTSDAVMACLTHCVALEELDLTGNHHLIVFLREIPRRATAFLRPESGADFQGFRMSDMERIASTQFWAIRECLARAGFARTIQRMLKRRREHLRALAAEREAAMLRVRVHCATVLVATARMFMSRKRTRVRLYAGRKIVVYARWFLLGVYMRKSLKARRHRESSLKRFLFRWMGRVRERSQRELLRRTNLLLSKLVRNIKKRVLKHLILQEAVQLDAKLQGGAEVMWEYHMKRRLMDCWKLMLSGRQKRVAYQVAVFMNCVSIESHNSLRQLSNRQNIQFFSDRRHYIPGWRAFQSDYEKAKRASTMLPVCIAHFERTFFDRIIRGSWRGLWTHVLTRRLKASFKARADEYLRNRTRQGVLMRHKANIKSTRFYRRITKMAKEHSIKTLKNSAFVNRFPAHVIWSQYARKRDEELNEFLREKYIVQGFQDMQKGCIWSKKWRSLVAKAKFQYLSVEGRKFFDKWTIFTDFSKNMETFVLNKYWLTIKKKVFAEFKRIIDDKKNYMQNLAKKMAADAEEADAAEQAMIIMVRGLTTFQAVVRAAMKRTWYREWSINAQYARATLQNFARKAIAKMRVRKLRRYIEVAAFKREEGERERMQGADLETQYYEYHFLAALSIQRCFRGWTGRLAGLIIAVEFQKNRIMLKQGGIDRLKQRYVDNKEKANELERFKFKAAVNIQRMGRGRVARQNFVKLKKQARRGEMAVAVQKNYRMRLAIMQRLAEKRYFMASDRFRQALLQRATLLRYMGFRKRKAQRKFAKTVLKWTGMDPITFNYRVDELIAETFKDFDVFKSAVIREKEIYQEHGRHRILALAARRKALTDQNVAVKMYDSVLIVERGHRYQGKTGMVVRVDSSIPGTPLYEVKLDEDGTQTFVNMTSDALTTYVNPQPLVKVIKDPQLSNFFEQRLPEIYGMEKDDPFYDGNNIDAAWVIQRAWRQHRAHNKTARVRYEKWSQVFNQQKEFINLLGDHNALTMQGSLLLGVLGLRPKRRIFFDEIRHNIAPTQFLGATKNVNEARAVLIEFEEKVKDRTAFIENAAATGKVFFYVGYERLTTVRKLGFFFKKVFGLRRKTGAKRISDIHGKVGVKFLTKKDSMVTGTDKYAFKELMGSPHVRYPKLSLYQGHWQGIPYVTPLRPHGDGVVVFMDGWGFAKEDKTLFITVINCRYLNAADMTTSDPYCDLRCNGKSVQTTVKWKNLNPDYYESFEIDVTNPSAKLTIAVYDKDIFGSDDLLGQIAMPLHEVEDGEVHVKKMLLRGEDLNAEEEFDRGEIEFRCQWKERAFEDDVALAQKKIRMATRLQAWARRIAAYKLMLKMDVGRAALLKMVTDNVLKIQGMIRRRAASKVLRFFRKRFRMAHKLQKRWWIFVSKRELKRRRTEKAASIDIQRIIRGFLGKCRFAKYEFYRSEMLRINSTCIQKYVRRMLARLLVAQLKAEMLATLDDGEEYEREPISDWWDTYGRDAEYGLRRSRRITERIFKKVLSTKYARVVSKHFGSVFVDSSPPNNGGYQVVEDVKGTESEEDEAAAAAEEEEATGIVRPPKANPYARENYAICYVTPINPNIVHRKEAIKIVDRSPYYMYVHIPSSIMLRESVNLYVLRVQCLVRQKEAVRARNFMLKVSGIFAKFQRHFRRRNEGIHRAAFKITSLFHAIRAKVRMYHQRREIYGVRTLQAAIRIWLARTKAFDRRSIPNVKVFKSSESVPQHGAEKLMDMKRASFWMNEGYDTSEVRVELPKVEKISQVSIMVGCGAASARFVTIEVLADKIAKKYTKVVENFELLEKGKLWHHFRFEPVLSKYYKFTFFDNWGDEEHLAVRQIRFVRSKEISATIIKHPVDCVMEDDGPMVGYKMQVLLKVDATGWPPPEYQWFCNEEPVPHATKPFLALSISCPMSKKRRPFRCLKCKMACRAVPTNCYHVTCGNCQTPFEYKEIMEYERKLKLIKEGEENAIQSKAKMDDQLVQMRQSSDERVIEQIPVVENRIRELQQEIYLALQNRCILKASIEHANKYSNEGVYTCRVSNLRGGALTMSVMSNPAVVFVEHSEPFILRVIPLYVPRAQTVRKKWTTYSSMKGQFNSGVIEGIVTIRYQDKSFYEGPYVPEKFLLEDGSVHVDGRGEGHYGIFTCPDGVVFEGTLVDNHFDPCNLQLYYRMTKTSGEVYEGSFVDEAFHGFGTYVFKDGSVYEGEWHRGKRFGYGHLRCKPEDYVYEGYFDSDRRHGEGVISWGNGAFYMGKWDYGQITGRGVYISNLSDVYKGQFKEGKFDGYGSLLYSNGARYYGHFKDGVRQGKGIFSDRMGNQWYGHYIEDRREGEFVVKQVVDIEEAGQDCFEIKIGLYKMGEFVEWKSKFANPLATKQFVKLFHSNKEMFDSVYSLIVARNLPNVPPGIDPHNADVMAIVDKLSKQSGELVGKKAMADANARVFELVDPLREKEAIIAKITGKLDDLSLKIIKLETDRADLWKKYTKLLAVVDKEYKSIEQFWYDDKTESRAKFQKACQNLEAFHKDDWFVFKNHRVPPPFNKKIMDTISILLLETKDWKTQQSYVSDSVYNSRLGDEDALRFNYACKLVHMMKEYDVFQYADAPEPGELISLVSDPRFRRESYYIEACGVVGPPLVDWVKANVAFVRKARSMVSNKKNADKTKAEAYRNKADHARMTKEQNTLQEEVDTLRLQLSKHQLDLTDLRAAMMHAEGMINFVNDNLSKQEFTTTRPDFYLLLERKLESQRDRLTVETRIELMIGETERRMEDYEAAKRAEARMNMRAFQAEEKTEMNFRSQLEATIGELQEGVIAEGYQLGYSLEPESNTFPKEALAQKVHEVVKRMSMQLNTAFNDDPFATEWRMMNGRLMTVRSLYVLAYKFWKDLAVARVENQAIAEWEEIFGEPEQCALSAVEARVNERMSKVARAQGRVWAKWHESDIRVAEATLAEHFDVANKQLDLDLMARRPAAAEGEEADEREARATRALEVIDDETGSVPPKTKAQASCWAKLNPDSIERVRTTQREDQAEEFELAMGQGVADKCVLIMNDMCEEDLKHWRDKAHQWRNLHMEEFMTAERAMVDDNAKQFAEEFPEETADNAARITEDASIAKHMTDEETLVGMKMKHDESLVFQAHCWGTRNQGKMRTSRKALTRAHSATVHFNWLELKAATENFQKGSYLNTPDEWKAVPKDDRFYGFRMRLEQRFDWLHGYLLKREEFLADELIRLEYNNPLGKGFANLRPSQADKTKRRLEDAYISEVKGNEKFLSDVLSKLSQWNSFFGTIERQNAKPGKGGATKTDTATAAVGGGGEA